MKQLILRSLNAPLLILLATLAIALQSSLFLMSWIRYLQPDLLLLLVTWVALRRPLTEGGLLTLILAHIAEIHSAVPRGVYLSSYMAIYLGVRWAAHVFRIPDLKAYIVVTFFASIIWKILTLTILHLMMPGASKWSHTLYLLLPGATIQVFIGSTVFGWMDRFDKLTFKAAPREENAVEDEF